MPSYRCHFLDAEGRLVGAHYIAAPVTIGEAIAIARRLLVAHPAATSFELWEGPERVFPAVSD